MTETLRLSFHITRRNWIVYRKNIISNIAPTFMEPIFFMLSLGIGLGALVTQMNGKTYLQFLAPGLAATTALFTSFFECSYGFFVRMKFENIFTAMLTTPIGVREIVIGEFIWVALKGGTMAVGVTLIFSLFGAFQHPELLPLIFWMGVLVALSCGAIGLLAAMLVENIDQFQTVYSFVIAPLFYFSGVFFPIEKMPPALQWIARALPVSQGVELSKSLYWNENVGSSLIVNSSVLVLQSAILMAFAYRQVTKKLRT